MRRLSAGDIAGAKALNEDLLVRARPLSAFHAVHVLMYGIVRSCEGDAREGSDLVDRAIASGWFAGPLTDATKNNALVWRVLMLMDLGRLDKARQAIGDAPPKELITPYR